MKTGVYKHLAGLIWLAVLVLAAAASAPAQDGDARDLLKRALDALPKVPFAAKLKLTTDQGPREVALSHKFVDGARASYLELFAPEELKGIRFLFLERTEAPSEQYMKVAAARTIVRVANEVRTQPFLGSTFYIADLIEPEIDASTYKFVGEEQIGGRRCMLIESLPKKVDASVYGKTVFAVDPKELLVMRRQFFDHKGKVLKVWSVDKVEKIDGFWTILEQHMTNIQDDVQSRLQTNEVKYNVELPESMFTPKYLLR